MKHVLLLSLFLMTGAAWLGAAQHPSGFVANRGQWPNHVLFFARSEGLDVWVTTNGMVYDQHRYDAATSTMQGHAIECVWQGPSHVPTVVTPEQTASVSFITTRNGATQNIEAPVYSTVRLANVYDKVDVVLSTVDGRVRYDLDTRRGADINSIGMTYRGGTNMVVAPTSITIPTSLDAKGITIDRLAAIQHGTLLPVPCSFERRGNDKSTVSFALNASTKDHGVTIDPTVYASYYGGDNDDKIAGMKLTSGGDIVIVGQTMSPSIPSAPGGYQATGLGGQDAFVAILDKKLHTVKSFTYLSGGNDDRARGLSLDAAGNIYVIGETLSSDFPTTSGSAGQVYSASIDGFVVKLSPDAKKLLLGMFINGNKEDIPMAVALDGDNNIFVVGGTTSTSSFPTTNGYKKNNGGQQDGFVMKIVASGAAYAFSSYYGNEGIDYFTAVTVDGSGAPYITGYTASSNFETAPRPSFWSSGRKPYDPSYNGGGSDAFCMKFGEDGSGPRYCTFFGGIGEELGKGVFADELGRCWIVGESNSTDLPATTGFQQARAGLRDVFMAGFSPDGKELLGSTYFGGTGDEQVFWMQKDASNNAVIGGSTTSIDFPIKGAGTSSKREGASDGFIASITFTSNNYADVISGSKADAIVAIDIDPRGDFYYAGITNSEKIPMFDTAAQRTYGGGANDGWIGKVALGIMDLSSPNGGESWCIGQNNTITWATTDIANTEKFLVELSSDDGATWMVLAKDFVGRSYVWKPAASTPAGTKYRARVTGERGHMSMSEMTFTVSPPPTIKKQPESASACANGSLVLAVEAEGAGLKYQWKFNGGNINGATTPSYTVDPVNASTAGKYEVVVSGLCNPIANSKQVTVSVAPATQITKQPTSVTVESGKPFSLTVEAGGDSLRYQWKLNGTDVPGAAGTQRTYTIAAAGSADSGIYTCSVTGVCGTVVSDAASVVITPTTSVAEVTDDEGFRILGPQPASDLLSIQLGSSTSPLIISILDAQGATIFTRGTEPGMRIIGLSVLDIPSGMYTLVARNGTSAYRARVVIVH